jgi:hypothetical protein
MDHTKLICLETSAFYSLLDEVLLHISAKLDLSKEPQWIDGETTMALLNIRSRTTLQQLRDSGKIRFSQTTRKNIMYDRLSIIAYLERNAQNTF